MTSYLYIRLHYNYVKRKKKRGEATNRHKKGYPDFETREIFPCGIRHPGLWISEFRSRNPESY